MKKQLLRFMFLLCALIVGSSVWGQVNSLTPQNGKTYVVTAYNDSKYYALPNPNSSVTGSLTGVEVTVNSSGKVTATASSSPSEEVPTWTFTEGSTAGHYYLSYKTNTTTYYLYKNGTAKSNYNFKTGVTEKNYWNFELNDGGYNVTAVDRGSNNLNIQLNGGSFRCYSSASKIILLELAGTSACATPTFSPAAGTYTSAQTVTISTETEQATIYYTTDGSTPTSSSTEYTSPITVSVTQTIKAIAVKDGNSDSEVATATYTINTDPTIAISTSSIEADAAGTENIVSLAYTNLTISDEGDFAVQYYDGEGEETDAPDWMDVEVMEYNGDYVVFYTIAENTSTEARTAYFKVYAMNNEKLVYSDLVTVTQAGAIPTHIVTWSVNGVTNTDSYKEGAAIVFPDNPADISGKTFVGWVTEAIGGTTNNAPDFVTSANMGQSDVTYYAVFAYASGSGSAEVVDVLNRDLTGVTGTSYSGWSGKTATSSAIYAGNSAGGNDAIQLRSNNNNSGIVTTTSGGKVKKVSITWNSNTGADRTVNVYGKNSAYSAASDLYNNNNQGTLLGTIVKGTSTELNIDGDYEYVGLRSNNGALYMNAVEITWSTGGVSYSDYCTTVVADTKQDAALSFAVTEVNANISEQFVAPTLKTAEGFNGTVEYESSDETVAQIMDSETGELRLLKGGTTTITATFAGNDDFRPGYASYTLTVTDDRIATTISVEDIVRDIADIATLTQLNPVVKDANDNIIDCTYEDFPPKVSYEIVSDANFIIGSLDNNSGEITLNEVVGTATLKATYNAFNVSSTYKPSECTFTITVESTQTIAEARAQGTGSVTTKGIVTSCSGTTAYIQDANAAICVYGSALTVGDEVKVSGTLKDYNGLLEITSPEVTVLSQNNTVTPEVMTIAQINVSDNQGWLVKIEDATVTAINGQNTTIAQGDNTIVVRGISGVNIAVDDVITLTGNIGRYYSAAQIANPTDVTIKVATPTFDPAAGEVMAGTTVAISTTTEDATIYYTVDGTEPTTESTEYTEAITINEAMTIKAIAVKDGMPNSDVATASYSIIVTPTITISTSSIEADAAGTDDFVSVEYANLTIADVTDFAVQYYDSEGEETDKPDWMDVEVMKDNGYVVFYTIKENTSAEARTAYFKVYAMDDNTNLVYSNLVTVTQAGYVAPAVNEQFELFTGELVEGDYVIYYNGFAMNTTVDNGRLQYAVVTPEDDVITTDNAAIVWHIAKSGDYWTIYNAEADAYAASTGVKNKAQMLADGTDDMALWKISGDGEYEFVNKKNSEEAVNAYLRNNGTYGFACYAEGTGGDLLLYKKVIPVTGEATITLSANCTDGEKVYGTYSNASAFVVPSDLTVSEIAVIDGKLLVETYSTGTVVPANTGVMVAAAQGGEYTVNLTSDAGTSVLGDANCLRATGEGITAEEMDEADNNCVFYRLTMHNGTDLGFYWGAAEGAAFEVAANKAYMAVPKAAGSRIQGFNLDGGTTTGISDASRLTNNGEMRNDNFFNLNGQRLRVGQPAKGLYIKGGKKVVVR